MFDRFGTSPKRAIIPKYTTHVNDVLHHACGTLKGRHAPVNSSERPDTGVISNPFLAPRTYETTSNGANGFDLEAIWQHTYQERKYTEEGLLKIHRRNNKQTNTWEIKSI